MGLSYYPFHGTVVSDKSRNIFCFMAYWASNRDRTDQRFNCSTIDNQVSEIFHCHTGRYFRDNGGWESSGDP